MLHRLKYLLSWPILESNRENNYEELLRSLGVIIQKGKDLGEIKPPKVRFETPDGREKL